jgi:hypothetical protein
MRSYELASLTEVIIGSLYNLEVKSRKNRYTSWPLVCPVSPFCASEMATLATRTHRPTNRSALLPFMTCDHVEILIIVGDP